jgi:ABC-type polysaccharide/polyol phosphate export permease
MTSLPPETRVRADTRALAAGLPARSPVVDRIRRRAESLAVWLELTYNLAVRDVEIRYKHSLLGLYWALVNPLLTAAIFSFVFTVIFHANTRPVPYPVFLITGLTFWNLFSTSVTSATTSITGSAALLAKLYFPRIVLPTAAVLARLIDFAFSLVVLTVFLGIFRVPVPWTALGVIPLLAMQVLFTLGIGYLVASVNVLYRDVAQLTGLVLTIWIWLTPVMYPLSTASPALRAVLLINPMGALLQAERDLLFRGSLSDPLSLWTAGAWVAFAFVGGLAVFKRIEPLFAEVM